MPTNELLQLLERAREWIINHSDPPIAIPTRMLADMNAAIAKQREIATPPDALPTWAWRQAILDHDDGISDKRLDAIEQLARNWTKEGNPNG